MDSMEACASIIVPVYKAEHYLHKCIDSILAQTYRYFELILIDDGSPDQCGAICDAYAARDQRVKVIHTSNQGVSHARNTGLSHATGEFVFFVDSDDCIAPDYIQLLLPISDEDMVNGGCTIFYDGKIRKRHQREEFVTEHEELVNDFRGCWSKGAILAPWSSCFKRAIIEKHHLRFDTEIDISEDELFNLQYLRHCNKVRYSASCGYHYTEGVTGSLMNRHHDCRTLSMIKVAQAKEQITQKTDYIIRWQGWNTALTHHRHWLKRSKGKNKRIVRKALRECYRTPYFRECIPYIRKHGSLDEKIETYFMRTWVYPLFQPCYSVVVFLSRIKAR